MRKPFNNDWPLTQGFGENPNTYAQFGMKFKGGEDLNQPSGDIVHDMTYKVSLSFQDHYLDFLNFCRCDLCGVPQAFFFSRKLDIYNYLFLRLFGNFPQILFHFFGFRHIVFSLLSGLRPKLLFYRLFSCFLRELCQDFVYAILFYKQFVFLYSFYNIFVTKLFYQTYSYIISQWNRQVHTIMKGVYAVPI